MTPIGRIRCAVDNERVAIHVEQSVSREQTRRRRLPGARSARNGRVHADGLEHDRPDCRRVRADAERISPPGGLSFAERRRCDRTVQRVQDGDLYHVWRVVFVASYGQPVRREAKALTPALGVAP